ncbi:MAG: L-threonylcarbamoyladenylate synthase [bacterium]|nr:L-threonylcarbamoyladenylate synthase [bacterium]
MSTFKTILDARSDRLDDILETAASVVQGGGTIVFPGDTSYQIGCDPYRSEAIDAIYRGKRRADEKPLALHVASPAEFLEYARSNPLAILASKRLMPGPVIAVVRKPEYVSDEFAAGERTIGIRVPDDDLARAILERCGPLAATTADPAGGPRYAGGDDISSLPSADLLVRNGPTRYDRESTIVDLSGPTPRLVRDGMLAYDRLTELLGPVERRNVKVRSH